MTNLSLIARHTQLTALGNLCNNGGKIRVYALGSNSQIPDIDSLVTHSAIIAAGYTLIATIPFANVAWQPPQNGMMASFTLGEENSATAGTASFFVVYSANGDALWTGTVNLFGANLNLNSVNVSQGARFAINGITHYVPSQAPVTVGAYPLSVSALNVVLVRQGINQYTATWASQGNPDTWIGRWYRFSGGTRHEMVAKVEISGAVYSTSGFGAVDSNNHAVSLSDPPSGQGLQFSVAYRDLGVESGETFSNVVII